MRAYRSTPARRVAAAILASCLVWACLAISCGEGSTPFRKRPSEAPTTEPESRRPSSSDRSAWFPASGPARLAKIREPDPLAGPDSIRDLLPSGPVLFVRTSSGAVFRVVADGTDGALKSERYPAADVSGSPVTAMAASSEVLFLSRQDGSVRAVLTQEGRDAWASDPGFAADWLLTTDTGHLVCVSAGGKLSVLSAADGSIQTFLDLGVSLSGSPVVTGSVLVVPKAAGISAFDVPALKFLWTSAVPPALGRSVWSCNGVIAFEDSEERFRVLDALSGTERYSLTAGGRAQAASDGERLYVAASDGRLDAYNLADGVPVWTAGSLTAPEGAKTGRERYSFRLAASEGRVYLTAPGLVEAWNAETGELLDRASFSGWADELVVLGNRLFVRTRGGSLCWLIDSVNGGAEDTVIPDTEAVVRPSPEAAERMAASLVRYSDPGSPVPSVAWRVYVPGAVRVPGYDFTVYRFEVAEAGQRVFAVRYPDAEGAFMAVYDSEGEERHVNVGELGVDRSFEQWLEPGVWYAVLGRLRGTQGVEPAFLDIR